MQPGLNRRRLTGLLVTIAVATCAVPLVALQVKRPSRGLGLAARPTAPLWIGAAETTTPASIVAFSGEHPAPTPRAGSLTPASASRYAFEASVPEPAATAGRLAAESRVPVRAVRLPSLGSFLRVVAGGSPDAVRGIYAAGALALRVVPQPEADPDFISAERGAATQFETPSLFGVVGLLAHNFLGGRDFFRLRRGQDLVLVYGNGALRKYRISEISDFQRLSQNELRSDFLELDNGQVQTVDQVFARFYEGSPHLTLQTCIARDGVWDWGVRFIVAEPVAP
jgi:hypothetical protein